MLLSFKNELWLRRVKERACQREEDAKLERLADMIVSRLKEPTPTPNADGEK